LEYNRAVGGVQDASKEVKPTTVIYTLRHMTQQLGETRAHVRRALSAISGNPRDHRGYERYRWFNEQDFDSAKAGIMFWLTRNRRGGGESDQK
jgi:erythromycin esterase-like protein